MGVYKRLDFGFGNEIYLSVLSIYIMDKAFMCRYFLFLFDVVFLIFEYSLSRKLLQLNMVLFNVLFPYWVFLRLNSSASWDIFLLHGIFAYYMRWLYAAISTSLVTFFKVLSERWISLFALGILLLPSIKFLSRLITSFHFSVQERIDWALISLFYFLIYFGGSSMDSRKKIGL